MVAAAGLSIKLRCASWQQLATIYKRDLSKGTMFLKAASPPPLGTKVRIDLTLPSASVITLTGTVTQHVSDAQRGTGVDLQLDPLPSSSVWLIESALASEIKTSDAKPSRPPTSPGVAEQPLAENQEVASAEHDLVKALLAEAESLKKLNPFLVLGVGYDASDADVRAAFGELTKRYHPDRFARYESKDLRSVAAEIFILIRDAYRKLGDEASRAQVLAQIGKTPAPRAVPAKPPPTPTGAIPSIVRPGQPAAGRPATSSGPSTPPPTPPKVPGRAATEPGGVRPTVGTGTGSVPVIVERSATGPVAVIPSTSKTPSGGVPVLTPAAPRKNTAGQGIPILQPPPPNATRKPTAGQGVPIISVHTPPPSPPGPTEHDAKTAIPGRDKATVPPPPTETPTVSNPAVTAAAAASIAITTPPPNLPVARPPTAPPPVRQPPPPPPMIDTGRPISTAPAAAPTAAAESGDSSELEAMLDAGKFDEALAAYKLLAKKHPTDRSYRAGIELVEGLRALGGRDRMEAAQRFEAALEIDPSSERAARELAEMRRQATNERKGLLSRLMGKKDGAP